MKELEATVANYDPLLEDEDQIKNEALLQDARGRLVAHQQVIARKNAESQATVEFIFGTVFPTVTVVALTMCCLAC